MIMSTIEERLSQRNKILNEILSSERNYVSNLNRLKLEYLAPIKQSGVLSSPEFQQIFSGNLTIICNVNSEVLKQLELAVNEELSGDTPETTVGDIFIRIGPFLKTYTGYVNSYDKVATVIRNKKAQNKKFKDFLEKLEKTCKSTPNGLDLNGYLIQPVQRIPEYNRLLTELIQYTEDDHSDYEKLVEALVQTNSVSDWIHDQIHELENREKLANIQKNMRNPNPKECKVPVIAKPERHFIREGKLSVVPNDFGIDVDSNGKLAGEVEVYVYLFSDLLLVCRKLLASSVQIGLSVKKRTEDEEPVDFYEFHIFLHKVPVAWALDCRVLNLFQIFGKRTYTFRSSSRQDSQDWVESIRGVMQKLMENTSNNLRGQPYAVSEVEHPIVEDQVIVPLQAALRGYKQRKRRAFLSKRRQTRMDVPKIEVLKLLSETKDDLIRNQMIEDRNIERRKTILHQQRIERKQTIIGGSPPPSMFQNMMKRRETILSGKQFRRPSIRKVIRPEEMQLNPASPRRRGESAIRHSVFVSPDEVDMAEVLSVAEEYARLHDHEQEEDREMYYKNMPIAVYRSPAIRPFSTRITTTRKRSYSDEAVVVESADYNEPDWTDIAPSLEHLDEEYLEAKDDIERVTTYNSLIAEQDPFEDMIVFLNPLYEISKEELVLLLAEEAAKKKEQLELQASLVADDACETSSEPQEQSQETKTQMSDDVAITSPEVEEADGVEEMGKIEFDVVKEAERLEEIERVEEELTPIQEVNEHVESLSDPDPLPEISSTEDNELITQTSIHVDETEKELVSSEEGDAMEIGSHTHVSDTIEATLDVTIEEPESNPEMHFLLLQEISPPSIGIVTSPPEEPVATSMTRSNSLKQELGLPSDADEEEEEIAPWQRELKRRRSKLSNQIENLQQSPEKETSLSDNESKRSSFKKNSSPEVVSDFGFKNLLNRFKTPEEEQTQVTEKKEQVIILTDTQKLKQYHAEMIRAKQEEANRAKATIAPQRKVSISPGKVAAVRKNSLDIQIQETAKPEQTSENKAEPLIQEESIKQSEQAEREKEEQRREEERQKQESIQKETEERLLAEQRKLEEERREAERMEQERLQREKEEEENRLKLEQEHLLEEQERLAVEKREQEELLMKAEQERKAEELQKEQEVEAAHLAEDQQQKQQASPARTTPHLRSPTIVKRAPPTIIRKTTTPPTPTSGTQTATDATVASRSKFKDKKKDFYGKMKSTSSAPPATSNKK